MKTLSALVILLVVAALCAADSWKYTETIPATRTRSRESSHFTSDGSSSSSSSGSNSENGGNTDDVIVQSSDCNCRTCGTCASAPEGVSDCGGCSNYCHSNCARAPAPISCGQCETSQCAQPYAACIRREATSNCQRQCESRACTQPYAACRREASTCQRQCEPERQRQELPPHDSTSSHTSSHNAPIDVKSEQSENVTTTIDISTIVHNNNTIHIPITTNFTHISNINIEPPSQPSININISTSNGGATWTQTLPPVQTTVNTHTATSDAQGANGCCTIVPPKKCHYPEPTCTQPACAQPTCTQEPQKVCGSVCNSSPLVMQHPTYIRVPVPVPVDRWHYVQAPQPCAQASPCAPTYQQQQYYQQPQILPMHYFQQYHQQQEQFQQYQQQQFQQQQFQQQQYQQQQTCPTTLLNGVAYPTCRNTRESQQFMGTSNQFLLDQHSFGQNYKMETNCRALQHYPWVQCYRQNIQDCKSCVFCGGEYNPQKCMYAPGCSTECQRTMMDLNLPEHMGKLLKCQLINASVQCR